MTGAISPQRFFLSSCSGLGKGSHFPMEAWRFSDNHPRRSIAKGNLLRATAHPVLPLPGADLPQMRPIPHLLSAVGRSRCPVNARSVKNNVRAYPCSAHCQVVSESNQQPSQSRAGMCARIFGPVGRLISAKTQQRFEVLIREYRESDRDVLGAESARSRSAVAPDCNT